MVLKPSKDVAQTEKFEIFYGDGFTIEDNIIKGAERKYASNDRSVGKIVYDVLGSKPYHIGQIEAETDKTTTFAEMKDQSVSMAIWMIKLGVKSGDKVSLCTPNYPDVYSVVFSTLFIGATYSPWDHELNLVAARHYMKLIRPKVLFTYKEKIAILQKAATLENHDVTIIVLGQSNGFKSLNEVLRMQTTDEISNFKLPDDTNPKTPCLIAFSSGTTGLPKGISHSYEKLLRNIIASGTDNTMESQDRVRLTYFYPAWAIHMWFLLDFILAETTQIFHNEFDAHETCKIIEKYKVDAVNIHTYKLMLLCNALNESKYNLESIKTVVPIGTKLSMKAINETKKCLPNSSISCRMGMTESGEISRFSRKCKNPLSQGIVRPNVQLKIVDLETGQKLGANQPGELYVKTPTMMIGYYKNSAATMSAFDEEGWLCSGDEAYYDEHGELVIVGRLKEIIKYKYYDVQPAYIEEIIMTHPNVVDVAIVPVPHEIDLERPVAFITTVPESQVTDEEILKLVSRLEFDGLLEGCIRFIEKMPRITNGKINKHVLKELAKKFLY